NRQELPRACAVARGARVLALGCAARSVSSCRRPRGWHPRPLVCELQATTKPMKLTMILSTTVGLALSLGATGCDKSDDEPADAKGDAKAEAKADAPTKDPAELLKSSKVPALPGPLATLKFGMSAEEAKKAAPELEDGGKFLDEYKGAYFSYYVPAATGKLKSASLQIEGTEMAKLLTEAWGEPKKGEDLGKPKYFWFNEGESIRATVAEGYGKEDEVQFEAYLPAKELLGEGKETLGFEKADRPLLGAT